MKGRSRYASDELVDRAAQLAKKHGVSLKLDAEGGVEITGKLDAAPKPALPSDTQGESDVDEEIRQCREAIAGKHAPAPSGS